VVLGIIGMHAIGLHGSQHSDPSGPAAPSAMPAMAGHDALPAQHGQSHGAVTGHDDASLVSPLDLGHGTAGMAILCIAVLAGTALARMLLRSQRIPLAPLRERVMASMAPARRTDARQTGPPTVWAFSVIRC
jgi:hypothetical protein